MKISLKWLNNYVKIDDISPVDLAHKLTFAGIEVEGIEHLASGTNLTIGQVLEVNDHPDSNHLHVTKVDLGSKYGVAQIVCGAPNVRKDQMVIVARVGAVLPKITIVKSTIRGVDSEGMICSLLELGVDQKFLNEEQLNGIEVLDQNAPIGEENVLTYLGLDDVILDLKILANRSDCLALLSVAREVGALFNRPVKLPVYPLKEETKNEFNVGSLTEKCPQFAGKIVKNICVKDSPVWLQHCLRAMGVRSINNVVDIGNYIMLLYGQPLHMYDLDKLSKNELIVRDDFEGDFVALDEKTYPLVKGDLVVTTNNQPMCLAGVMGSLTSGIDMDSKNVVIEAATFDPKSIRKTSTRLNLISEASTRFVKGINPNQTEDVLQATVELLRELCDAKEVSVTNNHDKMDHAAVKIFASARSINHRLGTDFDENLIVDTLKRVGINCERIDQDLFLAIIPSHRIDITLEADLCEEVIRLLGFDHIKSVLPELKTTVGGLTALQIKKKNIREYLINRGVYEALNYTLVNGEMTKMFKGVFNDKHLELLHPMTEIHKNIRTQLLPSLLESLQYNIARKVKNVKLFELSEVYNIDGNSIHLAVVLCGEDECRHQMQKVPFDFYHLKGILEGIMALLGIDLTRYKIAPLEKPINELHLGRSAQVMIQKDIVGFIGELHPKLMKKYDLGKAPTVVMELNLDAFLELKTSQIKMKAPSRFQIVERDLALVMDKNVTALELISLIKQTGRNVIKQVDIFDVYEGENIEANKKSVALRITYEDETKTFISEEIEALEKNIIEALDSKLDIKLRS